MSEPQRSEGTTRGTSQGATQGTAHGPGQGTTQRLPVIEKAEETANDSAPDQPDQSASAAAYDPLPVLDGENGEEKRFWSARRIPAGILALLLLVGAGLFLYDVAAVRADRPGMAWRRSLARELAERPLDDPWVLAGAGLTAVLGLWLLVLATTPGLREVLPMRRVLPDVRAGLHRVAAALALRDRAMEVSGVQSVRVRVGRTKVDVRAVSHFRDLDDVRADLDAALADGIRGLGLARPPALSVHVRRPGRKG
ncbi:hypothetical protein Sipo8835_17180 [Streptomyces ipomoeae]|jgi:hypothetical protein|uniref:DUF6286 domain-containing protein n=2 Tax=Streptomyces ipomoeae TaxID=103232 RepID=L1KKB0_9ACTN|nr:DUF6286 domain-containing protein [Streptomyces ipomoeae]EKX61042.1 hypothetical protein STRIP9103_01929 [Streptomyces ipomoeae 91-03]MDX2699918.1 DUF6286 domain-containing protein [Streptomyces ipomoeae]MDX2827465.1 DUF6286 domain-containing protein [Streptomyces ipomoeae]MDX2845549.1 DUF6286 domain-containing protein [Streptomyces ipomoeae]MDX2880051.1 DUF6286 domain-containing protein [Streptomyces ipomoeae]